jgi:hypothetical protein
MGVDGEIHSFRGPSVAGAIEFEQRLKELGEIADKASNAVGATLYRRDERFRWLIDRCLRLNGIAPSACSWPQIERLLFGWIDEDGNPCSALLIQIQAIPSESPQALRPPSIEELIAAIAPLNGGIEKAIDLLQNVSPKQLSAILAAQTTHPEKYSQEGDKIEQEAMADFKTRLINKANSTGGGECQEAGLPS